MIIIKEGLWRLFIRGSFFCFGLKHACPSGGLFAIQKSEKDGPSGIIGSRCRKGEFKL
jgi:hypothetical protein